MLAKISLIEKKSVIYENDKIIPKYLILHGIGYDEDEALTLLTKTPEEGGSGASAHYFVPQIKRFSLNQESNYPIYQLNADTQYVRHAGVSKWKEDTKLNSNSIGIEHSSPNYADALLFKEKKVESLNFMHFDFFTYEQIEASILLCKHLIEKYHILPENIQGHSDISPWRTDPKTQNIIQGKTDPGKNFPWEEFAKKGVGVWPCEKRTRHDALDSSIKNVQQLLQNVGYNIDLNGQMDLKTNYAIIAFKLHYLPKSSLDTSVTEEMIISLENLVDKKYKYTPFFVSTENILKNTI